MRRAPRIAPASRLAFGSGDTGERALPGVDRQWRRECDYECRGCAWALLRGGFCGENVRRGATDPLRTAEAAKAGDAVVALKQKGERVLQGLGERFADGGRVGSDRGLNLF